MEFSGIFGFFASLNGFFYILAYIVGGIPFGYIIVKLAAGLDLRTIGSGSIGATNVFRALDSKDPKLAKKLALLTILCDAFKGAAVILIAKLLDLPIQTQWAIALLAVFGHCFSPFLKFEGGKGVSTLVGSIIVFFPLECILGLIAWFIVGKVFKISSAASIAGVGVGCLLMVILHDTIPGINTWTPLVLAVLIVFYKHIPNIIRLIRREENKINI